MRDAVLGRVDASVTTKAFGTVDLSIDFGFTGLLSLGDRVWSVLQSFLTLRRMTTTTHRLDFDGNGMQDAGEGGLANVTCAPMGRSLSVFASRLIACRVCSGTVERREHCRQRRDGRRRLLLV